MAKEFHITKEKEIGKPKLKIPSSIIKKLSMEETFSNKFRMFICEQTAKGDCFEAGANYVINKALFDKKAQKELKLIHGLVHGQGQLEGVVYPHCWVEKGNDVIDKSNGRNIKMPKKVYYALGRIDKKNNVEYTFNETRKKMIEIGHYGYWDKKFDSYPKKEK